MGSYPSRPSEADQPQTTLKSSESYFDWFLEHLQSINLCLRPEHYSEQVQQSLQAYSEVSLYTDPYYGYGYALYSPYCNLRSILCISTGSEYSTSARKSIIQYLTQCGYLHKGNVIGTQQIDSIAKSGFLWTKYDIYLVHDFIMLDLEKYFEHRVTAGKKFTENELRIILRSVCRALQKMYFIGYRSFRMRHVYFCNMGELVKLAHPKLFNYRSNLAELCNDYSLKGIYLAPEELESLERADDTATHGLLANSFTVGVVMLALIMMKHQNDLYDYRGYRIDYTKLKETLALATPQYSRRFVNIIAKLLERKTADRLSIKEALNSLEDTVAIDNNDIVELMLLEQKPVEVEEERIYLPRLELPPQYPNFLAGIVHPKVTLNGYYYYLPDSEDNTPLYDNDSSVVANLRRLYRETGTNRYLGRFVGSNESHFMGSSRFVNSNSRIIKDQSRIINEESSTGLNLGDRAAQKELREGWGMYRCADGQSYIGNWHQGKMDGHGKLYYNENKLRYEGDFKADKFHGQGREYSDSQNRVREEEIDENFVRLSIGSWLKYEGRFKEDVKYGAGKVYFRKGTWCGNFKDGQPNGEGIFTPSDGRKSIKGKWNDGVLLQKL